MANNLSVKIGANTADLEKSIDRAKKTLEQYSRTAKRAKSEIENNVSVSNQQVNAYQRVVRQLEKVNSGTLATTQQQKVLSNQIKELKIQWNALTDDQRITGFGQSVANSLKAAESELETTRQKLAAVNTETNKTSKGMDNIGKSSSKTSNILGGLNGVLGKVGFAFGAAEVATTLFNGALEKSDEFGDLVTNKMAGLTNVVYSLGAALATLDFSGIINFYEWWKTGANASKAQDAYEDSNQQFQYMMKQAREAVAVAKETGKASDIAYAQKKLNALGAVVEQNATNAVNVARNRISKALKTSKFNDFFTEEIIDRALNATPKQQDIAKASFEHWVGQLEAQAISAANEARWGPKSEKKLAEIVKSRYNTLLTIATGAIWGTGPGERQQIFDPVSEAADMRRDYSRLKRMFNGKGAGDIKTPEVNASTPTVQVQEEKTLLQIYDDRIKKQEEELAYRQKNYEEINKRVLKERELTEELKKQGELERINWDAVKELSKSDVKPVSLLDTQQTVKSIEDLSKEVSKTLQPELDAIVKNYKEQQKAAEESMKQQMDGVKSLAGGISGLGQIIGGTAGQAISAMGQIMGLFPGMVDAIKQLTNAKQAEGMASAIAEGSKAPWFMQAAVIAGLVANVMATFASIPKFADGGIIQGGSKIGDYNIARVNDGEMILNGRQIGHLFKMLNDPYISHTPSINYMQPEVKIKGADIYLSQKNYKNITGRKL